MFDTLTVPGGAMAARRGEDPASAGVPLERLEAQICELAGHLAAATCRPPQPGPEIYQVIVHVGTSAITPGSPGVSPETPQPAARITPDTIIAPWYGERLDPDHAIHVCFANAANAAQPKLTFQINRTESARQPDGAGGAPLGWSAPG
jgi:hypothetical protein